MDDMNTYTLHTISSFVACLAKYCKKRGRQIKREKRKKYVMKG